MRAFLFILLFIIGPGLLAQPASWAREFPKTDFSRLLVDLEEISSGGPGRDGIPALIDPKMVEIARAPEIGASEPVLMVEHEGEARGYPLRYLIWHEIANDRIGDLPIAVTFCPLCNSALIFDRRVAGATLSFGVSGLLRRSDMVMYDHQSESFWQQATGEGIVGNYMGAKLGSVPARQMAWEAFKTEFPDALVMAQPDHSRDYGRNPYNGYDSGRPFLYSGEEPPHGIKPLARMVRVGNRAWLLEDVARRSEIVSDGVKISWQRGMNSALDSTEIAKGRDIGSITVTDEAGEPLAHDVMFAFAFHAFFPDGEWMRE